MGFDKGGVTVDSLCSTVQKGLSIDFSPIVYDSDWNSNRGNSFIPNRTYCYNGDRRHLTQFGGSLNTMGYWYNSR